MQRLETADDVRNGLPAGTLRLRTLMVLLAVAKAAPGAWVWALLSSPAGRTLVSAGAPPAGSSAAPLEPGAGLAPSQEAACDGERQGLGSGSSTVVDSAAGAGHDRHADDAHALCMTEAPAAAEGPAALWAWVRLQLAAALLRAWARQPDAQVWLCNVFYSHFSLVSKLACQAQLQLLILSRV